MIVNNNGLRYVKDYEESTVHSSASFLIIGNNVTNEYEWKIPFEKYGIAIDSVDCSLDYELYIRGNRTDYGRTELTLNSNATEIAVNTGEGTAPIKLSLKNIEGDPNFIIEISGNNPSEYDVELKIIEASIGYKAEVYDLEVGNNQVNIGKDLSVWGDASLGGDVSIGGSLTAPVITSSKARINELQGDEIKIEPTIKCKKKIVVQESEYTFEENCLMFYEFQDTANGTKTSDFYFREKGSKITCRTNQTATIYIFFVFEESEAQAEN